MKLIDKLLYIEYRDFIAAGWKEQTIKMANHRNGSKWQMIKNPDDKRMPMVRFDSLVQAHKDKLTAQFGNPYDYIAKEPIKALVQKDYKAEEFFRQYRFDGNKPLPFEHQNKYTAAASWLNMLLKCAKDLPFVRKTLGLSMDTFYKAVEELILTDKIDLPASSRKLRAKMDQYKTEGYDCLIDWRFGNKLSAKIGKAQGEYNPELAEKQTAFIRKAASMHNNFDAAQIARAVNIIFEKQGWPTISHGTVSNILRANEHLTTAGARGKRTYDSTLAMQVKRVAPQTPLLFFVLDGWTVELLYQDETGYNNRLSVVIVLDACTKYPIGYAIGDRENSELIRQANRNAIVNVEKLFGAPYRPLQLQSDRYALKNLTPFYEAVAKLHTPAAVGNAKSKIIEPYFNYINKQYFQRFPNWSGFNVTASKKNQPNTEYLDKTKHSFPDKAGVIAQIEMVMQQERKVKLAEYMQRWSQAPEDSKVLMDKINFLMVFGKPHSHTNSITGQGIVCTLNGQERTYDSFEPAFRAHQHLKWQLIYDEQDASQVLAINNEAKLHFLLHEKRAVPMDIYSTTPEDYAYLKQIKNFNRERKEEIIQRYITDDAIVQEVIESTPLALDDYDEASLKLMFTYAGQQKEALQNAKGLKVVKQKALKKATKEAALVEKEAAADWNATQMQYLQSKTDFNQYLD